MKPTYASNEMTQFAAHFDVSKIYHNFENVSSVNQNDDLHRSIIKSSHGPSIFRGGNSALLDPHTKQTTSPGSWCY